MPGNDIVLVSRYIVYLYKHIDIEHYNFLLLKTLHVMFPVLGVIYLINIHDNIFKFYNGFACIGVLPVSMFGQHMLAWCL